MNKKEIVEEERGKVGHSGWRKEEEGTSKSYRRNKGKRGLGRQEGGTEGARREWGIEGIREKEIKMAFGRSVKKGHSEVWMND